MASDFSPRSSWCYRTGATKTRAREERRVRVHTRSRFNTKQQAFLEFVLSHYVTVGVEELDEEKLSPLLRLKYANSIADAIQDLGPAEEIRSAFAGFQKSLYQRQAVA